MRNVFVLFLLIIVTPGWTQVDSISMIRYSPEFQFKDGIYLNARDLKNNNPIPLERVVTNLSSKKFDFYERLLSQKQISLYDYLGELILVNVDDVWGYVQNGVIFIHLHEEFNRIPIVGAICHFVANKIVVYERMANPTGYYNNRSSYYNNRYNNQNNNTTQYTSREMTQYIFDFESGEIHEYNKESLSVILMKDPELHDKFEDLSNRNQEKKKFYFIRQFNKRNPLYLPAK